MLRGGNLAEERRALENQKAEDDAPAFCQLLDQYHLDPRAGSTCGAANLRLRRRPYLVPTIHLQLVHVGEELGVVADLL